MLLDVIFFSTKKHFRNFETEMKAHAKSLGFAELNPNQTANELLGHLQKGDKVAITTRFRNHLVDQYVTALQARGIQARVVTGQLGIQDFCFLAMAQREMIGNVVSSYARWAAVLGNASTARLYIADTPELRRHTRHNGLLRTLGYNWTNPTLQSRVHFEVYQLEEPNNN